VILVAVLAGLASWLVQRPDGRAWLADRPAREHRLQGRRWRPGRSERRAREAALLGTCELLAADLRAGLTPEGALARAAEDWTALLPVAAVAELGGDVPGALRAAAGQPGLGDLSLVAAVWQVCLRSGGGLAPGLDRVAARLRQARTTRGVVDSELASARSTARLLAVLPVLALLMGSGLGGDPARFLLATPGGWACLATGVLLEALGVWWIDRIAAAVAEGR
jgi:tight adherence protein B